ncbi:hypothetical protein G6011_04520 [Alternaria panax]|uniref:Uncharacterized protein n=1 Tax=Alternaria panax TaxID=48097 RepID=A0AAD4NV07_9PLEO|nr:hypothetical protein G6011_04520 [Alternaria panax]
MEYHDVAGNEKQQARQGNEMKSPPQANVLAAASHVRRLFENKKFTYAIMGELAMLCLGHRCKVHSVFIAYDDKDYNRIKKKLEADRRVRLPEGMNPLFPSKMVVQTGPSFLDTGCTGPATIEVTLVPSGSYETPSNGTLAKNAVLLSLKTEGVLRTFYGLNMLYLIPRKSPPQSSGTPIPKQRSSRLDVFNLDGETVSRTQYKTDTEEEAHDLHLVGPQGVYQAPQNLHNPLPAANEATTVVQNPPPVFESDTKPPQNDILAELYAALQVSSHPCTSPPPALPQPHNPKRQSVSRTQPAPLNILPASLTIGNAPLTPPQNHSFASPMTQANALRYSKQYSPPSFAQTPNNVPASPPLTPAPLSVYKAYQLTAVPTLEQAYPISPPDSAATEQRTRSTSFMQVKDVDGMGHYFATHNRQASQHVQEVSQILDSSILAMEYRAALPEFDAGYGGK